MRTPIDAPIDAPVLPADAHESFAELAVEAGPDPLPRIRAALRGDVLAVGLAGEFDHYTCVPLHRLLADGAARGARRLVLDAGGVTFCDSALLLVLDRWVRAGGHVEVAVGSRAVRVLMGLAARLPLPPGGGFRP